MNDQGKTGADIGDFRVDVSERLSVLETQMETKAEQHDLTKLKLWMLGGGVGALFVLFGFAFNMILGLSNTVTTLAKFLLDSVRQMPPPP